MAARVRIVLVVVHRARHDRGRDVLGMCQPTNALVQVRNRDSTISVFQCIVRGSTASTLASGETTCGGKGMAVEFRGTPYSVRCDPDKTAKKQRDAS